MYNLGEMMGLAMVAKVICIFKEEGQRAPVRKSVKVLCEFISIADNLRVVLHSLPNLHISSVCFLPLVCIPPIVRILSMVGVSDSL